MSNILRITSGQIVCQSCGKVLKRAFYAVGVGKKVLMEEEITTCSCGKKQRLPLGFTNKEDALAIINFRAKPERLAPKKEVIIKEPA